eukprot:6182858-Pleurochrysis_carterae.AAC.1
MQQVVSGASGPRRERCAAALAHASSRLPPPRVVREALTPSCEAMRTRLARPLNLVRTVRRDRRLLSLTLPPVLAPTQAIPRLGGGIGAPDRSERSGALPGLLKSTQRWARAQEHICTHAHARAYAHALAHALAHACEAPAGGDAPASGLLLLPFQLYVSLPNRRGARQTCTGGCQHSASACIRSRALLAASSPGAYFDSSPRQCYLVSVSHGHACFWVCYSLLLLDLLDSLIDHYRTSVVIARRSGPN